MHQYVRPIKLPNWVEHFWFVPFPVLVAEHDELVHMICCNLPLWSLRLREHEQLNLSSCADLWDILLCYAAFN